MTILSSTSASRRLSARIISPTVEVHRGIVSRTGPFVNFKAIGRDLRRGYGQRVRLNELKVGEAYEMRSGGYKAIVKAVPVALHGYNQPKFGAQVEVHYTWGSSRYLQKVAPGDLKRPWEMAEAEAEEKERALKSEEEIAEKLQDAIGSGAHASVVGRDDGKGFTYSIEVNAELARELLESLTGERVGEECDESSALADVLGLE